MEFYLNAGIFIFGLGVLIHQAAHFTIFMINSLPGEELKWKKAPSLPSIKSRRLRKKYLTSYLGGTLNEDDMLKEQNYPMNEFNRELKIEDSNLTIDSEEISDIEAS